MRSMSRVEFWIDVTSVSRWLAISWFVVSSKVLYALQSAGTAKVIPAVGALTLT